MSISKNFVNLSERVRPFYVVDLHPTEKKGLCKSNWGDEHILDFKNRWEEKRFLILDSLDEVFFFSKNDPKLFGISSVFEICSLRKGTKEKSECTSLDDFHIGTFCIDIDDERLNPKSQYYDEEFDYSKNRLQGSELFCNALFDELSLVPYAPLYVWISNKGYHIVMRLTDDYIPLLGCKNVPFTNLRILEKYPKLKDIMKYLQIDILQQNNIKKPNEPLKELREVKSKRDDDPFNVRFGLGFEELAQVPFCISDPPKDKKQTFTTISQYERFNCSISKTMRVLNLLGLRIARKSGSEIFVSCPFHAEKTPSLAVNLDTGKWHCFGCGKGGGLPLLYKLIRGCPWKNAFLDLKSI